VTFSVMVMVSNFSPVFMFVFIEAHFISSGMLLL